MATDIEHARALALKFNERAAGDTVVVAMTPQGEAIMAQDQVPDPGTVMSATCLYVLPKRATSPFVADFFKWLNDGRQPDNGRARRPRTAGEATLFCAQWSEK